MDLMLLLGLLAMGGTLYAVHFWNARHVQPDWPDPRYRHTSLSCGKVLFRTEEPR
ncbi:hypothetical protein [Aeromonas intestinalis]